MRLQYCWKTSAKKEEPLSAPVKKSWHKLHLLKGHREEIISVAISPDSSFIVTGSADKTARIWATKSGALRAVLTGHKETIETVSISPDNRVIATDTYDEKPRIYAAVTGKYIGEMTAHKGPVHSVYVDANNTAAVSGEPEFGDKLWRVLEATDSMEFRTYSPDKEYLVIHTGHFGVQVWKVKDWTLVSEVGGMNDFIKSATITADNKVLVTASETVRFWGLKSGKVLSELPKFPDFVSLAALSKDSRYLVTVAYNKSAQIWEFR